MKLETQLTLIVGINNIFFYESMKHHTTLAIGGKAKIFVTPTNQQQIADIVNCCKKYNQDYCVIGAGSKLLVKDGGINKVVICLNHKFSGITQTDKTTLTVLSGTSLNMLNKYCMNNGLSGLENTFIIPATVGGAIHNNAGAYNSAISDVIKNITVLEDGKIKTYTQEQCGFSYRNSYFYDKPHIIILSAELSLKQCSSETIKQRMMDILNARINSQPIIRIKGTQNRRCNNK